VTEKVVDIADARDVHDHARKEKKLEQIRSRFKAANNFDKPTKKKQRPKKRKNKKKKR